MFLLLAGIVLLSSDARAQTMSFGRGDGTFGYDWTNFGAVGQGDTLVVRQVLIATGEAPVAVPFEPCGIELVTTAEPWSGRRIGFPSSCTRTSWKATTR